MPNTSPTISHPLGALLTDYANWCKRKGYTGEIAPEETRAIHRCQVIESLGYPATPAMIEKELKHTRRTNSRKQIAAAVTVAEVVPS